MAERTTRQKQAIQEVLEQAHRPLTPHEILAAATRTVPRMGIATVYRALRALAVEHRAILVEIPGQPPRYELAGKGHHHHFLCRRCGHIFELKKCVKDIRSMAPPRFKVEDHDIVLYGACADCRKKAG